VGIAFATAVVHLRGPRWFVRIICAIRGGHCLRGSPRRAIAQNVREVHAMEQSW
jgi:hypothetical protein